MTNEIVEFACFLGKAVISTWIAIYYSKWTDKQLKPDISQVARWVIVVPSMILTGFISFMIITILVMFVKDIM